MTMKSHMTDASQATKERKNFSQLLSVSPNLKTNTPTQTRGVISVVGWRGGRDNDATLYSSAPHLFIWAGGRAGQGDDVTAFSMLTVWLRRAVRQTAVRTNILLLSRLEQRLKKTCQSKHPGTQTCAGIDPSITIASFTEHHIGMSSIKCAWYYSFDIAKHFIQPFSLKKLLKYKVTWSKSDSRNFSTFL